MDIATERMLVIFIQDRLFHDQTGVYQFAVAVKREIAQRVESFKFLKIALEMKHELTCPRQCVR